MGLYAKDISEEQLCSISAVGKDNVTATYLWRTFVCQRQLETTV